jgi:DNA-binding CsgD family transcriptional regulator
MRNPIPQVQIGAQTRSRLGADALVEATPELSARELQCLRLAAAGRTSAGIGHALGISPRTVDEYIAGACKKLGVRNRIQAVAKAAALGLLNDKTP